MPTDLPELKKKQHGWAYRIVPIQETKWLDEAQADEIIRRCEAEPKLREQVEKLAGERLLIDNYCRINDIDLEQALSEKGQEDGR